MTVSTPSYVIPGTYLENVRFLDAEERVRGIELLFFYYDDETERLFLDERDEIESFADRFHFTVHMPDELTESHRRIIEMTNRFADSYVVHEPAGDLARFAETTGEWRVDYGDRFYLENLIGRDFPAVASALPDMPICLDTGHALLRGESPSALFDHYSGRIREIHLHGVAGGKDHRPFAATEPWFAELAPRLREFEGTINIELFFIKEVREVLGAMAAHRIGQQ